MEIERHKKAVREMRNKTPFYITNPVFSLFVQVFAYFFLANRVCMPVCLHTCLFLPLSVCLCLSPSFCKSSV